MRCEGQSRQRHNVNIFALSSSKFTSLELIFLIFTEIYVAKTNI